MKKGKEGEKLTPIGARTRGHEKAYLSPVQRFGLSAPRAASFTSRSAGLHVHHSGAAAGLCVRMSLSNEEIEACREAFARFDKDNSGAIDAWELRATLQCA